MKQFQEIFSDERIINYLCKVRAKQAKQRNKKHLLHILTNNKSFNYHLLDVTRKSDYEKEFSTLLSSLFPPRKLWKKIGEKSRIRPGKVGNQKISSLDKNIYSLIKTVHYFRSHKPNAPYIIRLNTFIREIQRDIENVNFEICPPIIYPKPKDKKAPHQLKNGEFNECRPLSLFNLKDRIILSFTNNYLTKLFDSYFEDCSLAFRAISNQVVNHHTAIERILEYRKRHENTELWVAECDMKKFYDSVNHKLILQRFDELIAMARLDRPHLDLDACIRIFKSYLNCYSFSVDVLTKNNDLKYWEEYNIPKGQFGWIEEDISRYGFYENFHNERIGVPQGGALSGLIANIVLNSIDKIVINKNTNAFYARFCDDMILMHPKSSVCSEVITLYKEALKEFKLAPHEFSEELIENRKIQKRYLPLVSLKSFWKGKSKGPYKWDKYSNGGFPWIGFVGYEIHCSGDIRVRKSSLSKEINKQKEVVEGIQKAISQHRRVNGGTISESAIKRLIGMSVGRVELWNYQTIMHELCWKNGFKLLNKNRHSVKQIKRLDKNRNKLYYDLIKQCLKLDKLPSEKKDNTLANRQIIAYNKPFSYYYHLIERENGANID